MLFLAQVSRLHLLRDCGRLRIDSCCDVHGECAQTARGGNQASIDEIVERNTLFHQEVHGIEQPADMAVRRLAGERRGGVRHDPLCDDAPAAEDGTQAVIRYLLSAHLDSGLGRDCWQSQNGPDLLLNGT